MKEYTCCFTGHRDCINNRKIRKKIISVIKELIIEKDVKYYCAGGAIGFDTIASLCVLKLKKKYPHIKLILILPCYEQDKYWSDKDKKVYNYIKKKADEIVYVSDKYTNGCMQKRNRYLVDKSKYCVGYCVKNRGGTYYTLNYAEKKEIEIIKI